ncbi:uncharacterized protein I206_101539 [Kwoniella pini CBS 10737]|uniref:ATPase n=1 Tax=Kwoniella pini CBS 10737 TaxID=1296096 RepID=A0A1B9HWD8_9TREE|nr:ATPase [Kwoniella pini CBS 10737]OCF47586.1 ATPase [Kwoniella pini CBS 10737]
MSTEKVECPICSTLVSESDINLHLDLQCRGKANIAGPSSTPKLKSQNSQEKGNGTISSPHAEIINLVEDTPTAKPALNARRSSGKSTGPVASIFNTSTKSKRKNLSQDEDPLEDKKPTGVFGEEGRMEKKSKINPLVANQPLAERSRPSTLASYIGQTDLVGPGSLLRARIEAGEGVGSCILWGPPGCGKTTLARLIARTADADFKELSATSSGASDVRQVFEQAKNSLKLTGRRTILMVDEIHRFNKAQQDLFLPYVENGWVQLIGATTENPSFKVNGALLSRCQVFTLSPHTPESLQEILANALSSLPEPLPHLPPDLIPFLADVADGDARQALNGLELALKVCQAPRQTTLSASNSDISQNGGTGVEGEESGDKGEQKQKENEEEQKKRDEELMASVRRGLRKGYDRSGEERYDMISAMHKCLRGSDGSAAMYWLARMITGGEDPLYIARRLVVMSSEDVGLADPQALPLAMATYQACQVIGLPECRINLAHCVAYLAEAPKSTRSYTAYKRAEALCHQPPLPAVPLQIRNAPTKLMKQLGYGKKYSYDPDYIHPVYNEYLPHTLANHSSASPFPEQHILKNPEYELKDKNWDEDRLSEWEWRINNNKEWQGRTMREDKA